MNNMTQTNPVGWADRLPHPAGWADHFSADAADLIRICDEQGVFDVQDVMLRCLRRSKAARINEKTVAAVLDQIRDEQQSREKCLIAELKVR